MNFWETLNKILNFFYFIDKIRQISRNFFALISFTQVLLGGITLILSEYEVNAETLLILPYGKNQSKVYEYNEEFIVNMTSLDIIKHSCLYFGCTYEGRRDSVKTFIGVDMKVPILIEESRNIIFFPTASCVNKDSIWISYNNLLKYNKVNEFSTVLYFKKNFNFKVDVKHKLIDNQVVRCMKLIVFLGKRKDFIGNDKIDLDF